MSLSSNEPIVTTYLEADLKEVPTLPLKSHMMLYIEANSKIIHKNKAFISAESNFVILTNRVYALVPMGIEIKIGENKYTLGPKNVTVLPVIIPKKTLYIEQNDITGIPKKLPDDIEFYLKVGTKITIPKNTIIWNGEIGQSLLEDTMVDII